MSIYFLFSNKAKSNIALPGMLIYVLILLEVNDLQSNLRNQKLNQTGKNTGKT
jgi:hypothetical protein